MYTADRDQCSSPVPKKQGTTEGAADSMDRQAETAGGDERGGQ